MISIERKKKLEQKNIFVLKSSQPRVSLYYDVIVNSAQSSCFLSHRDGEYNVDLIVMSLRARHEFSFTAKYRYLHIFLG